MFGSNSKSLIPVALLALCTTAYAGAGKGHVGADLGAMSRNHVPQGEVMPDEERDAQLERCRNESLKKDKRSKGQGHIKQEMFEVGNKNRQGGG